MYIYINQLSNNIIFNIVLNLNIGFIFEITRVWHRRHCARRRCSPSQTNLIKLLLLFSRTYFLYYTLPPSTPLPPVFDRESQLWHNWVLLRSWFKIRRFACLRVYYVWVQWRRDFKHMNNIERRDVDFTFHAGGTPTLCNNRICARFLGAHTHTPFRLQESRQNRNIMVIWRDGAREYI